MKQKKGFSLVELLIVIGIIAVLGGVMLTQFSSSTESALATSCLNNMRSLCNAVLARASRDGYYPSAGPFKYLELDQRSEHFNEELWYQGWVGFASGNQEVSCYYDSSSGDELWLENIVLREAMMRLNERERKIINLRFYKNKTQMEIAEEIGISQAQVSRLEKGALLKMRKEL